MKSFFEEKKRNLKFKKAGPGHKLNDPSKNAPRSSSGEPPAEKRVDNKESQEKRSAALAAALQRSLGTNKPTTSKTSLAASGSAACLTSKDEITQSTEKSRIIDDIVSIDKADEVAGVFFKCPEIGGDVRTQREWRGFLSQHIDSLKEQDPVLASILAIKSLNPPNKVEKCIRILLKYLQNLIDFPENETYKSIRMTNPTFVNFVLNVEGALDYLLACGFSKETVDGDVPETLLLFKPDPQPELQSLAQTLLDINGFQLVLDRDFKMLQSSDGAANTPIIVPDDFFEMTVMDIKKEHLQRSVQIEKESMLMTKKMREMDRLRNVKKNALYTRIRIRLPNDLIIQGTFSVDEKVSSLREFVEDKFDINGTYTFMTPPSTVLDEEKTFSELDLQPAVQLMLKANDALFTLKEKY